MASQARSGFRQLSRVTRYAGELVGLGNGKAEDSGTDQPTSWTSPRSTTRSRLTLNVLLRMCTRCERAATETLSGMPHTQHTGQFLVPSNCTK